MKVDVLDSGLIAGKKILVTYFSHSGNTREVADEIHGNVGGSIFEIKAVAPYPRDYDAVVKQAKEELDSGYKPSLKTKIGDLKTYSVVFLGYPNWWGTIPAPVRTLLSDEDFSEKIIVPFCTHEGSRFGRSIADIKALCPKSTILEGIAIRGRDAGASRNEVSGWLGRITSANQGDN